MVEKNIAGVDELCKDIPRVIEQNDPNSKISKKFLCTKTETPGVRIVLQELDNQVVRMSDVREVAGELGAWASRNLVEKPEWQKLMNSKTAISAVESWLMRTEKVLPELPKSFRFKSDPGLCFERLPFDVPESSALEQCPTFAEFLSRCDNADAVCAWVWSLFEPDSERQFYAYLRGEGGDGKSRFASALMRVFGMASSTCTPREMYSKHFTHRLVNARFCYVKEVDAKFTSDPLFRDITGDEHVYVEQKYKDGYRAKIDTMFLLVSNEKPELSSLEADRRRVIYCEVQKFEGKKIVQHEYDDLLDLEMSYFLSYCRQKYSEGAIKDVSYEALDDIITDNEEEAIRILNDHFVLDNEAYCAPADVYAVLKKCGLTDQKMHKTKAIWSRRFGIKKKTHHRLPRQPKVYWGLSLRDVTLYGAKQKAKLESDLVN